jgi:hypothetical protein
VPANPDPKHGRWILPLIILAMGILTWTFVSSLEPAQTEEGTSTTDPSQSTTTSTTLPPEYAAFLVTLDAEEQQAEEFLSQINGINADWEDRSTTDVTQDETATAFENVKLSIEDWELQVADADEVPQELAETHVELVLAVQQLGPKVDDIVDGLLSSDDGSARRAAVAEFGALIDDVIDLIDQLRAETTAAAGGVTEDTTDGSTETTTSTTVAETTTTSTGTST